jgi:SOS-response transcriptional repressor LexA
MEGSMKLGERIRALREAKHLTGTQLGELVGVGRGSVSSWESGDTQPANTRMTALAEALGVSVDFLLTGNNGNNTPLIDESTSVSRHILPPSEALAPAAGMLPLITWEQAGSWSGKVDSSQVGEWLPCQLEHGPNAYYVEIVGDSMADASDPRSFREGHIVGVDPDRAAEHRSFVVVQYNDATPVLRQLIVEGDTRMLKALNPEWPNRFGAMREDHKILGVVFCRIDKPLAY